MIGTLCRLIPLDTIDGRVVKYRVEIGDVGECVGVVMFTIIPTGKPYEAHWHIREGESGLRSRSIGRFRDPETAALALATEAVGHAYAFGYGEVKPLPAVVAR